MSNPRVVNALACYEPGLEVKQFQYTTRELGADDVEVAISHCAICGSDVHKMTGRRGPFIAPMVPGHEIIGTVTACGPNVSELHVGDRVGIGAMIFSCQDKINCAACRDDDDPLCPKAVLTYNSRYADGTPTYGGYADFIRVHSSYAFKIPEELPSDVTAPLLCAGITVYTPLKDYTKPGDRVGVVGIGGLGHLALQFALALDAIPVAISHSPNKETHARALGAQDFVVISNPDHVKNAAKSLDVVLVTADASNQPWNTYISMIKKGGKLVSVGLPQDNLQISPFALVLSKVSIVGSAIGGIKDTKEMLALAAKKGVRALIDKLPMSEANKGIEMVEHGTARYRVVLEN